MLTTGHPNAHIYHTAPYTDNEYYCTIELHVQRISIAIGNGGIATEKNSLKSSNRFRIIINPDFIRVF